MIIESNLKGLLRNNTSKFIKKEAKSQKLYSHYSNHSE